MAKIDLIVDLMSNDEKERFYNLSDVILKKLIDGKQEIQQLIKAKENEIIELKVQLAFIDTKIVEWEKVSNKKGL